MTPTDIKRILSKFFIIPEHRFESELSGPMDIRWENGRLALNSANANYSFNRLHKVMQKGLNKVLERAIPAGQVLNLGMGAGSTVCILREELGLKNDIISVEHDPAIIAVARSYFDLDRFKDHTVICEDAYGFVMNTEQEFALIIIDLFKDKEVGERFTSPEFIIRCESLLVEGGVILFNYIGSLKNPLAAVLQSGESELLKLGKNRVMIYQKTERS